jgi:CSLREA domain-containing protein
VIRLFAVVAALAAALVAAPAALAASYTVNDPGDAPDADPTSTQCATATATCTLRAAIQAANADPAGPDTIGFASGVSPTGLAALPQVTGPLSIDGGGSTTVTFAPTATGPLLDVHAANSLVRAITFTGGGSGPVIQLSGAGDRLDTVTAQNTPGTAIQVAGSSERVDGVHVASPGGTGIAVSGSSATISSPDISGAAGDGISLSGDAASVGGGTIHGNGGNGVSIGGQNNVVSRVTLYGNRGRPIANAPGANGGIGPPQNLRIGPRRADGSLPLTGTGSGTVELWSGDPSSSAAPSFVDSFGAGGDFTYNFPSEPQPGAVFAASITGGSGTSEFATVSVPADTSSPDATSSRALDTQNVRVDFSEPLDPNSVNKDDFKLNMAGIDRTVSAATVAPDGRGVTLASSGWKAGEAGIVQIVAPGAVTDTAGNAMTSTPRLRVAAAPGDFIAPLGSRLRVSPGTICLTHARTCKKPGMTIRFNSTEAGKATLLIKRSNVTVGRRLYGNITAGPNTLKFNGRLGSRKLRVGRYRLLMYVQDQVGNVTDQPPITLFSVRRVTG